MKQNLTAVLAVSLLAGPLSSCNALSGAGIGGGAGLAASALLGLDSKNAAVLTGLGAGLGALIGHTNAAKAVEREKATKAQEDEALAKAQRFLRTRSFAKDAGANQALVVPLDSGGNMIYDVKAQKVIGGTVFDVEHPTGPQEASAGASDGFVLTVPTGGGTTDFAAIYAS